MHPSGGLTSAKYLPFQSYPTRPKKLSSAHSYCPPSKETPSCVVTQVKVVQLVGLYIHHRGVEVLLVILLVVETEYASYMVVVECVVVA